MKFFLLCNLLFVSVVHAELLTLQESIDRVLKNYPDVKSFEVKGLYELMVEQHEAVNVVKKDLEVKSAYYV
jgi:hypothetical protein